MKIGLYEFKCADPGIGPRAAGAFGITADLVVDLPDLNREQVQQLVDATHHCIHRLVKFIDDQDGDTTHQVSVAYSSFDRNGRPIRSWL